MSDKKRKHSSPRTPENKSSSVRRTPGTGDTVFDDGVHEGQAVASVHRTPKVGTTKKRGDTELAIPGSRNLIYVVLDHERIPITQDTLNLLDPKK